MTMLTTDQITEIAETLEALGEELATRNWGPARAESVVTAASANLVSIAAMRAPVPQQQAYFPPPPSYGYGPEGCDPSSGSPPLSVPVTGGSRQELEDRARSEGQQVFGPDAVLDVRLTGIISRTGHSRGGEVQYTCQAEVRETQGQARHTQFSSLNDN